MALYTLEQITLEVENDKAYILGQNHPEDVASEYADSACPLYYSEIIQEWDDLPEEYSNKFSEMIDTLPDRIEDLMKIDLYLYYYNFYSGAIAGLIERESEEVA